MNNIIILIIVSKFILLLNKPQSIKLSKTGIGKTQCNNKHITLLEDFLPLHVDSDNSWNACHSLSFEIECNDHKQAQTSS